MATRYKLTVKGYIVEEGIKKNVTIATWSDIDSRQFATEQDRQELMTIMQAVTSATITSIAVTDESKANAESIGTPGDPLNSAEIFAEEFSDTQVVPTMSIVTRDSEELIDGKTKNYTIKYMADPVNTPDFDDKAQAIGSKAQVLSNRTYIESNLTFTAKEEVHKPA